MASNAAEVLFTPAESTAFSSFLNAVDSFDPNVPLGLSAEWNMYSSMPNPPQVARGKEDLAKATKDLISFGDTASHLFTTNPAHTTLQHQLTGQGRFSTDGRPPQSFLQDARSWPSVPTSSPAGYSFNGSPADAHQGAINNGISVGAVNGQGTLNLTNGFSGRPHLASLTMPTSRSSSSSHSATPRSMTTPISTTASSSLSLVTPSRKRPSVDLNHSNSLPNGLPTQSNKRQKYSPSSSSNATPIETNGLSGFKSSRNAAPGSSDGTSAPRRSSSVATSARKTSPPSGSSRPTPPTGGSSSRPTLLTPEEKKQNHIHSEQKRRANIRRGYDALCDAVPQLRDAIRAEDALCASSGKKRGRGRLLGDDGEKLDGRAGPRSESVVLQKTIEYMHELQQERDALLGRLQRAQAVIPPGHPAHMQGPIERPWERIWNGGIGLPLNDEPDAYGESGDEEGGSDED